MKIEDAPKVIADVARADRLLAEAETLEAAAGTLREHAEGRRLEAERLLGETRERVFEAVPDRIYNSSRRRTL